MMKKYLSLILILSVSFAVNAQGNMQRMSIEERVKQVMSNLVPALALTAEQQPKTDSAFTHYYRSMQTMRAARQEGTRPDRTEMEKLSKDRDEKLKQVLSPDQYKKFKEEVESTLRPQRGNRQ